MESVELKNWVTRLTKKMKMFQMAGYFQSMKMNEFGKDWEKNISSVVSESVDLRIMKSLKKKKS